MFNLTNFITNAENITTTATIIITITIIFVEFYLIIS